MYNYPITAAVAYPVFEMAPEPFVADRIVLTNYGED